MRRRRGSQPIDRTQEALSVYTSHKLAVAIALSFLDRVNELRGLPGVGLPVLTPTQARDGIVLEYMGLP